MMACCRADASVPDLAQLGTATGANSQFPSNSSGPFNLGPNAIRYAVIGGEPPSLLFPSMPHRHGTCAVLSLAAPQQEAERC